MFDWRHYSENGADKIHLRFRNSCEYEYIRAAILALQGTAWPSVRTLTVELENVAQIKTCLIGFLLLLAERGDSLERAVSLRKCNRRVGDLLRIARIDEVYRLRESDVFP